MSECVCVSGREKQNKVLLVERLASTFYEEQCERSDGDRERERGLRAHCNERGAI